MLPMDIMVKRTVDFFHREATILDGFAHPKYLPDPTPRATGVRAGFPSMETCTLKEFVSLTRHTKVAVIEGRNLKFWNATFYSSDTIID